ncbi:MAG: 50S ribosomal protein L32 [Candidatus Cloacimonetes bacterium]|nr:50S ribosomal protein L32 [Candidatus Cloacimonadota bacterium]MCK4358314.1 50S ribosomal protein L32 [Candidatus Cloacimonadota bacterium]
MAVPKRKTSKSRSRKRRTHYKAYVEAIVKCSNCGESKRPHFACPHCGFYRGKKIISISE